MSAPVERLLITGIAGGQGRLVAKRVADQYAVSGVDRAPWEGHPDYITVHTMDLRKKKFEDIFRRERPTAVVHLAFVRHFRADPMVRHEINVSGTKRLLEILTRITEGKGKEGDIELLQELAAVALAGEEVLGLNKAGGDFSAHNSRHCHSLRS